MIFIRSDPSDDAEYTCHKAASKRKVDFYTYDTVDYYVAFKVSQIDIEVDGCYVYTVLDAIRYAIDDSYV